MKKAIFTFGRFQPPTRGHSKLINEMVRVAKEQDIEHFVIPSVSVDHPSKKTGKVNPNTSRNPLPHNKKLRYLKTLFPGANVLPEKIKSPWDSLDWFKNKGYTDLIFIVGSDRLLEFEQRLKPTALVSFNSFEVMSAGVRDPDKSGNGVVNVSATKARKAAKDNNLRQFRTVTGWNGRVATEMMKDIRQGMGVE